MSRNTGRNRDKGDRLNLATPRHKSTLASDASAQKGGNPKPCYTAGRAVPSHAANRGIKARTAAATAARHRAILQEVLLQTACKRREEAARERRYYDRLEAFTVGIFLGGWLFAILSHL